MDSVRELGEGTAVHPIPSTETYATWAEFYDEPGNQLIDLEQPVVREILDGLPPGIALDAGCGTGRHSAYLASLGHTVIGVDTSAAMLKGARRKVPQGEFHEADVHQLPLPDDNVDLVVCGLALMHVPDLAPVLAEFVRVLRPSGNLVISDWRGLIGDIGMPVVKAGADGSPGYLGLAPLGTRRDQRRVLRQPRCHHLALPARRSLNPPKVASDAGEYDSLGVPTRGRTGNLRGRRRDRGLRSGRRCGASSPHRLDLVPRLREHVAEDRDDLVELALARDERRRELDDGLAPVVGTADQAAFE
jgi:SAM-dependent methyltransferase